MDILDRYLVKEFVIYFFAIHLGLGVLGLGMDFLSHMWEINLDLTRMLILYSYKFPFYLQQFFPLAVLLATLVLLTTMSRSNEILALYCGGIGSFRIVSTLVAVVATLSTFYFLVFDSWVPAFNSRRAFLEQGIDQDQLSMSRPEGGFWYRSNNLVYNIGRYLPERNRMEDVSIYFLEKEFHLSQKLHAAHAQFNGDDWILGKGFAVKYPGHGFPELEQFDEMDSIIPEKPTDFKAIRVQEESMRLKELRRYLAQHESSGLDTTSTKVHYHERLAYVFSPLIFLLLAIPLGIQPMRSRSLTKNVALAFMTALVYLVIARLAISVGRGGFLPPYVAAWLPNVTFLGVSLFLLTRRGT